MLYENQVKNGLRCISDVRARYDGKKRNLFDEAECGHYYTRAMASWAAVMALTGFHPSSPGSSLRSHRLYYGGVGSPVALDLPSSRSPLRWA